MNPEDLRSLIDVPGEVAMARANEAMSSDDRNVRVAGLRVIERFSTGDLDAAAEAAERTLSLMDSPGSGDSGRVP